MLNEHLSRLLDSALESSEIAWWEWDFDKNIVFSNDLKTTMLGYEPGAFAGVGYKAYTDLLHPDDYERTMDAMREHLSGKAEIYQVDYRILKADGSYTWYMDRGSIIERDENGNPLRLRGVVLDLGESLRKQARDEAVLKLIRKKLPISGRDKDVLVLCSSCKKIKISKSLWVDVDDSFEHGFLEKISHGICPDCIKLLYPDEAEEFSDSLDDN